MAALLPQIIDRYHGLASNEVIHAVEKAADRTGADFSFLMQKAATESSFNPAAKAKSSSATGLFQFIESTWLTMVKEHGAKYGLGRLADQIEVRGGKPCVDDCRAKETILNLRKNPEISALMAGEFSAGNKKYLQSHTGGRVGATEMYLAHFMGAGGGAEFLNSRDDNGDAVAASLFPKEARANKNVFFDTATGQARTLNEIYDSFAQKFNSGDVPPSHDSTSPAPAQSGPSLMPKEIAQALLSFSTENKTDAIIWNDDSNDKTGFLPGSSPVPQKLSAEAILIMQTVMPPAGPAADPAGPSNATAQFTLDAAANSSVYDPIDYPELFGTQEVKSNDITAFKKWTDVMQRFERQMGALPASSPRIMEWQEKIRQLQGKSTPEQIEGVNAFINKVPYIEDIQNYGKTDYWATPVEFLSKGGDCEDFAIAKYASLRALGFSPQQLRIAVVQDEIRNTPHAVLIAYSDAGNFVLDNQDKKVEAIADVSRYRPIFSINSTGWWLHKA
jgi:predicted transglutaminase-like cysteine proteinase